MMSPLEAMDQASSNVNDYASQALRDLARMLEIELDQRNWRIELVPFVPVWAAMIAAAAQDFDTAVRAGRVGE